MFKKIKYFFLIIFSFSLLFSCQKKEILKEVVFDNILLPKANIYALKKEIKVSYESTFNDPYIEHVMKISPKNRIISWFESNINNFGNMHRFEIDIIEASIARKEIKRDINVAGVNKKQDEFLYEMNIKVLFLLIDDSDQVLANVKTDTFRSTTSSKFISLNERDLILNKLTFDSLRDLSKKSVDLIEIHMSEYVL